MSKVNRRKWLKLGVGLTAGTVTSGFVVSPSPDESCGTTTRQELGPFPPMKQRKQADKDMDLTVVEGESGVAQGKVIVVAGRVTDTTCGPVEAAVIEIWQANHHGKYNHEFDTEGQHDPNFQGWGQVVTDKSGRYQFKTILPGLYGSRTRHIHFKVSKRGYHELVTQLYFEGEPRNETDILVSILSAEEQKSVTKKLDETSAIPEIQFDLVVQPVAPNRLPEKVLAEYSGKYLLDCKGKSFEGFARDFFKVDGRIEIEVQHQDQQLFFTLPFAPSTEVVWKARDRFDASSFYQYDLVFSRDAAGKVSGMIFESRYADEFETMSAHRL